MRTTVKQYNSIITWREQGTPDTKDSDGNVIPGIPGGEVSARCRFENFRLGNRKEFRNRDGISVLSTGVVYIKFGDPVPPRFFIGTITRNKDGKEIYKGEVVNPFEGQMNGTVYTIEDVRN